MVVANTNVAAARPLKMRLVGGRFDMVGISLDGRGFSFARVCVRRLQSMPEQRWTTALIVRIQKSKNNNRSTQRCARSAGLLQ